jgi:hypothetical protein
MDWIKLTGLHIRIHIRYLALIPLVGVLASQMGFLGRLVAQVLPILILERMVVIETTAGVRLMRLTLPVSRLSVVVGDVVFCYAVVLYALTSAWLPAFVGLAHTFAPQLVDLASLMALAGLVSFTYNTLGPMASTSVSVGLLCLNMFLSFRVVRSPVAVNVQAISVALLLIALSSTTAALLVSGRKRHTPIDLLPPGD